MTVDYSVKQYIAESLLALREKSMEFREPHTLEGGHHEQNFISIISVIIVSCGHTRNFF